MIVITVREHARLTTKPGLDSLDEHTISESALQYLCELSAKFSKRGASLVQVDGRKSLKLENHVGVIETPCGTVLEILPKHVGHKSDAAWARQLLRKMLWCAMDLPRRDVGAADLELFNIPLDEWVMARFLAELDSLVKRGLRFDYVRVEEESRFLRGQLNVTQQMRQPPGRQHLFQIRHDVFLPDRPENRLLKSALDKVCQQTRDPDNWRLSHELASRLAELAPSPQHSKDFRAWRHDHLMAHYQPVKPWCKLVLGKDMPLAIKGDTRGKSFLFPMEKLFERYVAHHLSQKMRPGASLTAQASSEYMCRHTEKSAVEAKKLFQLKPDLLMSDGLVSSGRKQWVLDTKWKLIDKAEKGSDDAWRKAKYGLSQGDFYQMFAYGHKYLKGEGDLFLIYPKTDDFPEPLPVFDLSDQLKLWVVPFDLVNDTLVTTGCESALLPLV